MGDVFIPVLAQTRVVKLAKIRRERLLPVRGAVLTAMGARVGALDIIAKSNSMGHLRPVPLARYLRTSEANLPKYLLKKTGEDVAAREIIASKPEFFGTLKRLYRAPSVGRIAAAQGAWLAIELADTPFELKALYRGSVVNLMPRMGAVIEATGALVQGAWGIGSEGYGVLKKMTEAPDGVLGEDQIDVAARGNVLIAGAGITESALRRAVQERAAAVIVGSLKPELRALVNALGLPLIVTEGLGNRPMCKPIFDLLSEHVGDEVAVNVSLSARNGARPEVFIPVLVTSGGGVTATPMPTLVAEIGALVRIVGGSRLGELGKLDETPALPRQLESGVSAWGAEIELLTGGRLFVPWENLELLG
jgi:hypothetical protein